MEVASTARADY